MSTSAPTTDPALNGAQLTPSAVPNGAVPTMPVMDQTHLMELIKSIPGVLNKLSEKGNIEEAAATLRDLSQQPYPGAAPVQPPLGHYQLPQGFPHMTEAGPSSHPNGPPNLGQVPGPAPPMQPMQPEEQGSEGEDGERGGSQSPSRGGSQQPGGSGKSRSRSGRSANMSNDEWARQRKDNHKEVERRRRGNINDGINELGRIVPNGTGEKAKGAILSRAVQYIHHLKENEARNIEKWTLEKLLMDQAMGDLQAQLEEVRRAWEEERHARQRLETELEVLRGMTAGQQQHAAAGLVAAVAQQQQQQQQQQHQQQAAVVNDANPKEEGDTAKRRREDDPEGVDGGEKRPRVE